MNMDNTSVTIVIMAILVVTIAIQVIMVPIVKVMGVIHQCIHGDYKFLGKVMKLRLRASILYIFFRTSSFG